MSTIQIKRFYTQHSPHPSNPQRMIDMVEYGPVGSIDRSLCAKSINEISKVSPLNEAGGNKAVEMANDRWSIIKPAYEAWKSGQELPEEGTPLGAWNAITAEQAATFKTAGVKTVEQVAQLTDATMTRIAVPRIRDLVTQAQRYIASTDVTKFSQELAAKDRQIENQQEQLTAQSERIEALLQKVDALANMVVQAKVEDEEEAEDTPAKRGPGRPRKDAQAA